MTDLENAVKNLEGHTICLCKGQTLIFSDKKGIAPMMELIAENRDLDGFSVADAVVGKAAAMLFVKAGIKAVFARVISRPAMDYLSTAGVNVSYGTLSERIINRSGTDTCPMEKAVLETDDPEDAYLVLKNLLLKMK